MDAANHPEKLSVVRDHQEIQRRLDLYPGPVEGVDHRLAPGVAVGHVRVRGEIVVGIGVEGVAGVQVGVAPQQLLFLGRCGSGDKCCQCDSNQRAHGMVPYSYSAQSITEKPRPIIPTPSR